MNLRNIISVINVTKISASRSSNGDCLTIIYVFSSRSFFSRAALLRFGIYATADFDGQRALENIYSEISRAMIDCDVDRSSSEASIRSLRAGRDVKKKREKPRRAKRQRRHSRDA